MDSPLMPPKVREYSDRSALLDKLGRKATLWERTAREARERAEEFERASAEIRAGATSVVVGRTTYTLACDEA